MSYSYSVCYCYECLKLDLSDQNRYNPEKYYCPEYRQYVDKNDRACSRYFVYNESLKRDGCFITTAVTNILGLNDDNVYLNKLRNFRENYMRFDDELKKILLEYDVVGPAISISLKNDTFKRTRSLMMMELYIKPICQMLDNKLYTNAINKYIEMVSELKDVYNINMPTYNIEDIDDQEIGKGHKVKIKEN